MASPSPNGEPSTKERHYPEQHQNEKGATRHKPAGNRKVESERSNAGGCPDTDGLVVPAFGTEFIGCHHPNGPVSCLEGMLDSLTRGCRSVGECPVDRDVPHRILDRGR